MSVEGMSTRIVLWGLQMTLNASDGAREAPIHRVCFEKTVCYAWPNVYYPEGCWYLSQSTTFGRHYFSCILISSSAPKFDKRYTDSYSGMQELFNNSSSEPTNAERVAFLQAGVEVYALQFFARQLGFGQTWSIPPCYSKSFQERFHTITKVEAQTIDARNASLITGFSLAPFNHTTVVHLLFRKFWLSVKRRFFTTNVNHAFHLLEGSWSSRTSISSIPDPIHVVPISIRRPVPSSSPSKSPLIRTRRSATGSLQSSSPPAQTRVIIGASSRKHPVLGSSDRPDDNSDDDDDAPPHIRRNRGSISPLKDSTPPIPSSPLPSVPSNKEILPEKELEGPETSITQTVGESSLQGVLPSSVELEEIPIDFPVVQELICPDKDESSQAIESPSDILPHSSSRVIGDTDKPAHEDADTILRSIQNLFTSWEQVKVSHVVRSSSASRPSAASAAFSIENMNILKQAILEYTSFMDMDIVNASATS
ncbi:hypothetical protein Adt_35016 [Abeliophyllum distichum]|uniref:Uncharacterized protein n=1 Tax=Abeliophyllum distichum TaxID=126358 RepID=A0ABD1QDJ0_9LAMI